MVTRYRLDSQFHCSYLESRGVPGKTPEIPGKKNARNYFPLISGFRFTNSGSGDVISVPVQLPVLHAHAIISGDVTIPIDPPQIINGWCFYTTND